MAQKILEKLDILDEQEKILLTKREKVNRLHYGGRKKSLNTPLTCDFQSESEPPITKPALKTASMIEEDKSYTNKLKRSVSFKCDPEDKNDSFEKLNVKPHFVPANENKQENKSIEKLQMIEENPKSKSSRPLLYLKDTPEVESFLNEFYSYNDSAHRRSFGSSAFSPVLSIQSNVYKKEKDSALFTSM
ncbi:uncharacterized protein C1orf141 homolog [Tenrec ecaudatus]|uniref:uncharacterized protein C1orf141 homolog n=1 Tax=Tenrec ecaudatus TaxID=94439 RepID=UPI003F5A5D03